MILDICCETVSVLAAQHMELQSQYLALYSRYTARMDAVLWGRQVNMTLHSILIALVSFAVVSAGITFVVYAYRAIFHWDTTVKHIAHILKRKMNNYDQGGAA